MVADILASRSINHFAPLADIQVPLRLAKKSEHIVNSDRSCAKRTEPGAVGTAFMQKPQLFPCMDIFDDHRLNRVDNELFEEAWSLPLDGPALGLETSVPVSIVSGWPYQNSYGCTRSKLWCGWQRPMPQNVD